MKVIWWCVALLAMAVPAWSASSGDVGMCEAHGSIGCNKFKTPNTECTEPPGETAIMWWVYSPVRSASYTVQVKGSPTSYRPGSLLELTIKVTVPDRSWKYRGLLMHATDLLNKTVGEFELPAAEDSLFWTPPGCPGRVLHTDAEQKPYHATVFYRAPKAGAGTITFKSLFKRGPANEGYFYYPEEDPVLVEQGGKAQTVKIVRRGGGRGEWGGLLNLTSVVVFTFCGGCLSPPPPSHIHVLRPYLSVVPFFSLHPLPTISLPFTPVAL
jgi:hypothetical protein